MSGHVLQLPKKIKKSFKCNGQWRKVIIGTPEDLCSLLQRRLYTPETQQTDVEGLRGGEAGGWAQGGAG